MSFDTRKEKTIFFTAVAITSILLSLLVSELHFRVFRQEFGAYMEGAYKSSVEALNALEHLDSTYTTSKEYSDSTIFIIN